MTNKLSIIAVKKTTYSKKNLLVNMQRKVIFLSETFEGKMHDKKWRMSNQLNLKMKPNCCRILGFGAIAPKMEK